MMGHKVSVEEQIANCPTPVFHETHRYCPSCPWRETPEVKIVPKAWVVLGADWQPWMGTPLTIFSAVPPAMNYNKGDIIAWAHKDSAVDHVYLGCVELPDFAMKGSTDYVSLVKEA